MFDLEGDYVFASYLIRLRVKELEADPYFVNFGINSFIGRDYVLRVERRAIGQANINSREISEMPIPICSISEQRRIAAKIQELMQDVDRARAACEKQLGAAKALPAAYLREVFESEEAKKWERKSLGDVCKIIMGQSPPSDFYNKKKLGLPFFQGKADFGDYFPTPQIWCSAPTKIANPNDVLISVRAPVGPVSLSDQECCIGRGLSALRPNEKLDSWFLFFYLKKIENSWKGRGSTFDAIKKNDLDNIEVPVPPYSVQKSVVSEIRRRMSISEDLRSITKIKKTSLDAIPQAIFKKAFRGEL